MRTFDTPITTTDQNVDRVLNAGLPVVMVFFNRPAPKSLEQTLKDLAERYAGRLLVVKIAAEDGREIARRYSVQRLPALVSIRGGQVASRAEAISGAELESHARFLLGEVPKPAEQKTAAARAERPTPASSHAGGPIIGADATFDEQVLRSPVPVLVDFWAPWCGPCRMVEPIVERLAQETSGRLRVVKVNVDENPQTSGRFQIRSIPTMMIFKDGQVVDQWSGALPEPALRSRVSRYV